jgi:hypothetical protein
MQEFERGLSEVDFFVFFISLNAVRSTWVARELEVALYRQLSGEGGAHVVAVILEDADVPPLLRQFRWLNLRGGDIEQGVATLVEEVRRQWTAKHSG